MLELCDAERKILRFLTPNEAETTKGLLGRI